MFINFLNFAQQSYKHLHFAVWRESCECYHLWSPGFLHLPLSSFPFILSCRIFRLISLPLLSVSMLFWPLFVCDLNYLVENQNTSSVFVVTIKPLPFFSFIDFCHLYLTSILSYQSLEHLQNSKSGNLIFKTGSQQKKKTTWFPMGPVVF